MGGPLQALRIEYDKTSDCLILRRLNYKRFSFHGFGSFIWQARPEDVSISPSALEALKGRVGKESSMGDLAGADFSHNTTAVDKNQRGFILNYGYTGPYIEVPLMDVVVDYKTFEMLKTASVSNQEPEVSKEEQEDLLAWQQILEAEENGDDETIELLTKQYYSREEIP